MGEVAEEKLLEEGAECAFSYTEEGVVYGHLHTVAAAFGIVQC